MHQIRHIRWLAAFLIVLYSGCAASKFQDVSTDPQFNVYIGQVYSALKPIYLHGVNLSPGYGDEIYTYFVYPVATAGREYVYRKELPAGTKFEIVSVEECTNCVFSKYQQLVIKIYGLSLDKKVSIPIHQLENMQLALVNDA